MVLQACRGELAAPDDSHVVHLIEALQRYLAFRIERGLGTELTADRYRGLSPQSKLILKRNGASFCQNTKRRVNFDGVRVDYKAADSLQGHVTRLYKDAGIKFGSSHSGRRSFASNLLRNGASLERVQQLLGHSSVDHCLPYLTIDPKRLREMFASVI